MPKDATKNVDRYKVRGGQLNEFEITENQKALAENKPKGRAKLIPGTPPEKSGDGMRPAVKASVSNAPKATKKKASNASTPAASTKKRATRKTATKK